MKLYMKQKTFSVKQDFDILDAGQRPVYHVEGKLMSLKRKLRIYDSQTHEELAAVEQQLVAFTPTMHVYYQDERIATIRKKITFLRPSYEIDVLGWTIDGDYFAHDYNVLDASGRLIADISKKLFSWSDTFEIDIKDPTVNPTIVLAVVLAIDMAMDSQK